MISHVARPRRGVRGLGPLRFRSGFRLDADAADAAYLERQGLNAVLEHASKFIRKRLAPAQPPGDGRQTSRRGHPVFVAQHATATCCRSCLAKWHRIEKGRPLSPQQVDYIMQVIHRWLEPMSPKQKPSPNSSEHTLRTILHVDMDAFYASVEERENLALVGKPLIVGGTPEGRGVVAAANYAVRRFGVHSAMSTAMALRLCPDAIVLPPRMDFYAQVSRQIRDMLFRYTPLVEPLSLDEALLDVTGSVGLFGSGPEIARRLKEEIRRETGLVASVGVAPNKFLAKIASDLEKPDGLVVVEPSRVREFLDPLPVGRLWGVGTVTGSVFDRLGVRTIGDIRRLDLKALRRQFGQQGEHFWKLAHGQDDRPVVPDRDAKSISHETTFAADITDIEALRAWLLELTEHVGRRLRRQKRRGRTVQLKLRFADFRTITRAKTLPHPTDITHDIWQPAGELLTEALRAPHPGVRLLGVGVSGFAGGGFVQKTLFDDEGQQKQRQLDAVADAVRQRFGSAALNRGSGLLHDARHRPEPRPREPDDEPS